MNEKDALIAAWNALRNEALGRGAFPPVWPTQEERDAARFIAEQYAGFRDVLANPWLPQLWGHWSTQYEVAATRWRKAHAGSQVPAAVNEPDFFSDSREAAVVVERKVKEVASWIPGAAATAVITVAGLGLLYVLARKQGYVRS